MEDSDLITIAVLAGTTRKQRASFKVTEYIAAFGRSLENVDIVVVDPIDFDFPGDGNDP
jgi:NAD(P)H-dependent FMN reductase